MGIHTVLEKRLTLWAIGLQTALVSGVAWPMFRVSGTAPAEGSTLALGSEQLAGEQIEQGNVARGAMER